MVSQEGNQSQLIEDEESDDETDDEFGDKELPNLVNRSF